MCSLFDMYFMQMIMYCYSMKCFGKPCFQMGVFKNILLFSQSISDRLVPTFCMLYLYMYLLLLHFMFPGENKELKKKNKILLRQFDI